MATRPSGTFKVLINVIALVLGVCGIVLAFVSGAFLDSLNLGWLQTFLLGSSAGLLGANVLDMMFHQSDKSAERIIFRLMIGFVLGLVDGIWQRSDHCAGGCIPVHDGSFSSLSTIALQAFVIGLFASEFIVRLRDHFFPRQNQ